jgi:cold shock CspA family protein
MLVGRIQAINYDKGYVFIGTPVAGKDVFFYVREVD